MCSQQKYKHLFNVPERTVHVKLTDRNDSIMPIDNSFLFKLVIFNLYRNKTKGLQTLRVYSHRASAAVRTTLIYTCLIHTEQQWQWQRQWHR